MDSFDKPLKGTRATAYWAIRKALQENPALSLLTRDAIDAVAAIAVNALLVKEDDDQG